MFRFRELIELWRSDNSLIRGLNDSYTMLESTHQMFVASVKSLRQSDKGEITIDIYKMDQMVNKYETKVRRNVLRHLAITGGVNIIPGLVLTSIVIDIERIGDYTKNIRDLARIHPKRLHCGRFEEDISKIEVAVEDMFAKGIPIFKASDKNGAHVMLRDTWWVVKKCDDIVDKLIVEDSAPMTSGDAVATSLYARYLKRIAAHFRTVVSSVVNPFERIGFRDEDEDEEPRDDDDTRDAPV